MHTISYRPSDSMSVQGSRDEVFRRYANEWHISEEGGGHGNWLLTKKADVLVDGKSCREFILDHYSRKKITDKLAEKFQSDLENGIITFEELGI